MENKMFTTIAIKMAMVSRWEHREWRSINVYNKVSMGDSALSVCLHMCECICVNMQCVHPVCALVSVITNMCVQTTEYLV